MIKTKKFVEPEITRQLKRAIGEDIKAFAKKSGILYESLRTWCNGTYLPSGKNLKKLEAAGIDTKRLFSEGNKGFVKCPFCGDIDPKIKDVCHSLDEMLKSRDKSVQMLCDSILRSVGSYKESKRGRSAVSLASKKKGRTEKKAT